MVWGAFWSQGTVPLQRIRGNITAQTYTEVLEQRLLPLYQRHNPPRIFQQDNARPHTARHTTEWFADHNIAVMVWPPQSPDLNPIENLWSSVKRQLDQRPITNCNQLFDCAPEIWRSIDDVEIDNLLNSMP